MYINKHVQCSQHLVKVVERNGVQHKILVKLHMLLVFTDNYILQFRVVNSVVNIKQCSTSVINHNVQMMFNDVIGDNKMWTYNTHNFTYDLWYVQGFDSLKMHTIYPCREPLSLTWLSCVKYCIILQDPGSHSTQCHSMGTITSSIFKQWQVIICIT